MGPELQWGSKSSFQMVDLSWNRTFEKGLLFEIWTKQSGQILNDCHYRHLVLTYQN
jgi:hypothetical protein